MAPTPSHIQCCERSLGKGARSQGHCQGCAGVQGLLCLGLVFDARGREEGVAISFLHFDFVLFRVFLAHSIYAVTTSCLWVK